MVLTWSRGPCSSSLGESYSDSLAVEGSAVEGLYTSSGVFGSIHLDETETSGFLYLISGSSTNQEEMYECGDPS